MVKANTFYLLPSGLVTLTESSVYKDDSDWFCFFDHASLCFFAEGKKPGLVRAQISRIKKSADTNIRLLISADKLTKEVQHG